MNKNENTQLTEAVLAGSDYRIYNRESCLKGKPLKKVRASITDFSNNQLDRGEFLRDILIAYRLHWNQLSTEIQQLIPENNDKDEGKYNPIDPQEWSPTLTKQQLISKAEFLVTILGKAIEKAKEKVPTLEGVRQLAD